MYPADASGPVVYWMSREMRVKDNWALGYAATVAKDVLKTGLVVVYNLEVGYLNGGYRNHVFKIEVSWLLLLMVAKR